MLVNFDDVFVEHALKHGYVSAEQIAECKKAQKKELEGGRKYYLGQVLIRKRFLSCGDFLEIENELGHKLYECAKCKARYGVADLSEKGTLSCKGCGADVKIDGGLSIVEILASRDPRDLTISLCPTNQDAVAPAPIASAPTKVVERNDRQEKKSGKSRLNRAVLELSKDELQGLARYEVLDELGRGGMGIVFKARQVDIDRVCALKVIKAGPSVPEVQINRFVQEARSAAQLNHPNIVTVYDFGRYRDMFYIAMEFIPGTPLAKLIADGQLTISRALDITDDLLGAVSYAHSKGVIHRDLKPQNILVETERGRARLIDFGLAKDNTAGLGLTQTGQILGSPFYLSPEQTRGESRNVDPRSDVFAIGVILYEMTTRARPFTGRSAAEVYAKILKERPAPPSAVEPDVDQALQAIILEALEKKPEDRFQSADDFQKAIRDYKASRPAGEESAGPAASKSGVLPRKTTTTRMVPQQPATSSRTSSIKNRSSDRAIAKRTSAQIAAVSIDDRRGPPASSGSSKGLVVAGAIVLALVAALAVGSQGHSATTTSGPTDDTKKPDVAVVVTNAPSDDPGFAATSEKDDLAAVEGEERDTPTAWGSLLHDWKALGERYPRLAARSKKRVAELEAAAEKECDQLTGLLDAAPAEKQGETVRTLQDALRRFANTRLEAHLTGRIKKAEADAWELATTAARHCDSKLALQDYDGAIAAVSSPDHTGFPAADKLLADARQKVADARARKESEAAAKAEQASEEVAKRSYAARVAIKERRYDDALKAIDEALGLASDADSKAKLASVKTEATLVAGVLQGALKADIEAALKAKKDVNIEVTEGNKAPAVRVQDGTLFARPPAGSGELEYPVAKLPPRGVCRLFELSKGNQQQEAPLARALFLLNEGVLDGAKLAFEEARRRNVDVSAFEARFAALPDPPARSTETLTTNGRPADEKPVKDDGALIAIPGGTFVQGVGDPNKKKVVFLVGEHDPDRRNEFPKHDVQLDAFQIGKYEVTNHQYAKFLELLRRGKPHRFCHESEPANKDHTPALWKSGKFGGDAHPVVGVDWWDAYAYCKAMGGRLPTEAEWERAARGTDERLFPWGNEWDPKRCVSSWFWAKDDARADDVWEKFNDWVKTAPRVTLPVDALDEGKSATGAYNMAGNVAEWVGDWYERDYYAKVYLEADGGSTKNPPGPPAGSLRVVRGGRWGDRTPAFFLTTARTGVSPGTRVDWLGFRCAKGADQK